MEWINDCFAILVGAILMSGVWAYIFRKSPGISKISTNILCIIGLTGIVLALIWNSQSLWLVIPKALALILCVYILFDNNKKESNPIKKEVK